MSVLNVGSGTRLVVSCFSIYINATWVFLILISFGLSAFNTVLQSVWIAHDFVLWTWCLLSLCRFQTYSQQESC